jgi:cyclase
MAALPATEHVEIVELAEGVIASLARYGKAALSNAGAVNLGDTTVVFDTHGSPQAAGELRSAAIALAGRSPRLVVWSHDHNDHILGGQAFAGDAVFAASEQTRQLLLDSHDEDLAWAEGAPEHLAGLRAQAEEAESEAAREAAESRMGYIEALAELHGQLEVVVPQMGLEGRTVLEGSLQSADLITFDRAHAGGDMVLHLPFEGIVFTGDIVFVGSHPFIGHADPQALLDALHAIERMRPKVVVPGHGPLGGLEDLQTMQAYLADLAELARVLIAQGEDNAAGIGDAEIPERYATWGQKPFFYANLRALVTRLSGRPIE